LPSLFWLADCFAGGAAAQAPSSIASPAPNPANEVGISSRDGITMSGNDVIVTRNGISEKLTKELELTNGTRVKPTAPFITSDGGKLALSSRAGADVRRAVF